MRYAAGTSRYLLTAETQRKPVLELNSIPKPVGSPLQDSSANSASLRWIRGTLDMHTSKILFCYGVLMPWLLCGSSSVAAVSDAA